MSVFQVTSPRSCQGGRWSPSATPSSSAWSWSSPAPTHTGPATPRGWSRTPASPWPVCSDSTPSPSKTARPQTQERWPLWRATARPPLGSPSLVRAQSTHYLIHTHNSNPHTLLLLGSFCCNFALVPPCNTDGLAITACWTKNTNVLCLFL